MLTNLEALKTFTTVINKGDVSQTAICPRPPEKPLKHNYIHTPTNHQEAPNIKLKSKTHKDYVVSQLQQIKLTKMNKTVEKLKYS